MSSVLQRALDQALGELGEPCTDCGGAGKCEYPAPYFRNEAGQCFFCGGSGRVKRQRSRVEILDELHGDRRLAA